MYRVKLFPIGVYIGLTYIGEERGNEDHEDIVEEQADHENGYYPRTQEHQPANQIGQEGKAKKSLKYPSVDGVSLHHPPGDNSCGQEESDEELGVRTVAQ